MILNCVRSEGGFVGWCCEFERAGADVGVLAVHGCVGIVRGVVDVREVVVCASILRALLVR